MWTGRHRLIGFAVRAIALVIGLVAVLTLHAFVALMIGAVGMGLAGGLGVGNVVKAFEAC